MMSRGESYLESYPMQAKYDQRAPSQTPTPSPPCSAGLSKNEPPHRSDLGRRGLFSKRASNAPQRGYDQAMAVLSKDETFDPMADIFSKDQGREKVGSGSYDPYATKGTQQNSLYVLMKNDKMIYAKHVGEMMEIAQLIWRTIYKVQLPLIRIPDKRKEFVHFRMMSLEDKMKALALSANKKLRKEMKLHFMGKLTLVKDLPVASLPFVDAHPGTRQEALDALIPLRGIKYEDQIAARSDSIKSMLKNVVLCVRKTLNMQAGSENQLTRCFFDEPELREFIPMGTSVGFARFTTIDLGKHPSTRKPTPGVLVYYGPDEDPLVYFLPLEDCTHISPLIIKAINDLFGFLSYEGFVCYDPIHARNLSLFKFRAMMSTSGKMIVTVELSLDDNYIGNFEEIVTKNGSDQRRLYLPIQEPLLIPDFPFMKENSLDQLPPTRDLIKCGGMEHLSRIRSALQKFHEQYGFALGVEGIYITWYYVNERPVEWGRFSKIWHHACGIDFVSEFIMGVHLPMYPHISTIHFPHTQAFPKILKEIVEYSGINRSSRVMVLSEYLFLAEFFGQICLRTIFMRNETTEQEREYLEKSLRPNAIKFLCPRDRRNVGQLLEPGGDVVIIWSGNRSERVFRNIAVANYRLVVLVRDGLKRVQHDKQDTFVSLATVARCMFPYMALKGCVAIDLEPQGNTMPALISFFSKAPSAPPMPAVLPGASAQRTPSKVPKDQDESPTPPPTPIISKQPDNEFEPLRNELERPQTSKNKLESQSTPGYKLERWSTGGFEPHDDECLTRRQQNDVAPHSSQPLIESDSAKDSGSVPALTWFSPHDVINDADKVKQIMEFVWRNGGHKEITNITPDRSLVGWKMLSNLQKSLRNQRNKGKITLYPFWYHNYLTEYEPNVQLPRDLKRPLSLIKDSTRLPSEHSETPPRPTKARSSVSESPAKTPRMGPGRSTVVPPSGARPKKQRGNNDTHGEATSDEEESKKIYDVQFICEYIWKNGGHAGLLKMKLDQSIEGWRLLRNIQKTARNRRRKGEKASYPTWYRKSYIPQFEPFVVLPSEPERS